MSWQGLVEHYMQAFGMSEADAEHEADVARGLLEDDDARDDDWSMGGIFYSREERAEYDGALVIDTTRPEPGREY